MTLLSWTTVHPYTVEDTGVEGRRTPAPSTHLPLVREGTARSVEGREQIRRRVTRHRNPVGTKVSQGVPREPGTVSTPPVDVTPAHGPPGALHRTGPDTKPK